MSNLKNKKAIITGGGRGLGKATALAFAKEGIDVAITGRTETVLKETVAELETFGVKATYRSLTSSIEDCGRAKTSLAHKGSAAKPHCPSRA